MERGARLTRGNNNRSHAGAVIKTDLNEERELLKRLPLSIQEYMLEHAPYNIAVLPVLTHFQTHGEEKTLLALYFQRFYETKTFYGETHPDLDGSNATVKDDDKK